MQEKINELVKLLDGKEMWESLLACFNHSRCFLLLSSAKFFGERTVIWGNQLKTEDIISAKFEALPVVIRLFSF